MSRQKESKTRTPSVSVVTTSSASPFELIEAAFTLLAHAARRAQEHPSHLEPDEPVYTTKPGHGPPGLSQRKWRKLAPTIRGARRLGRWWIVSRAAFDEHSIHASPRKVDAVGSLGHKTDEQSATETWSPESALHSAGLLRIRNGGR